MSREQRLSAIIIKKQPYGEGDEIVTFYSRERGKVRGLAKSSKFAKSKLQYNLQTLFAVNVTLSGSSGLPKVIGVEAGHTYSHVRVSLEAVKIAFYALELLLKFTPDEQKNEQLFELYEKFFSFLDACSQQQELLALGLEKFKIDFSDALGLAIQTVGASSEDLYFTASKGGFTKLGEGADHMPVSLVTYGQFLFLQRTPFNHLSRAAVDPLFFGSNTIELSEILSSFLHFQLEREIKSERYLSGI